LNKKAFFITLKGLLRFFRMCDISINNNQSLVKEKEYYNVTMETESLPAV
jgi:hypothetical protein